jgi:hypothetical protein
MGYDNAAYRSYRAYYNNFDLCDKNLYLLYQAKSFTFGLVFVTLRRRNFPHQFNYAAGNTKYLTSIK